MIAADVPPQAPQVQVQQIQQKSAAQVRPSIEMVRRSRGYRVGQVSKKPNGGAPTHKRNRRFQLKHGFKAVRG